ncbi:MAG: AAA family ATPase, partial [Lutimonas sp.]
MNAPLAERIRPKTLEEYIGQGHLIGENGILSKQMNTGLIPSMILWGPPGIGKTTLAHLIANKFDRPFYQLSAIQAGVKEVREIIESAKRNEGIFTTQNPILFIDEIHRFSKSQQDSLLGAVEKGIVTLIGATTENPSFEVIPALLSRCQVYILNSFDKDALKAILLRAIDTDELIKKKNINLKETEALIQISGGDARKLLNIFEILVSDESDKIEITNDLVLKKVQKNVARYDKSGEQHYDIISAFIKSIRGSDPNGAVY